MALCEREANILDEIRQSEHPHKEFVVTFFGSFVSQDMLNTYCIVMENVAYGALDTLITDLKKPQPSSTALGLLDWGNRLKIIYEIFTGLAFLHDQCQILHRDIKSGNILLAEGYKVKITDFGLAIHKEDTEIAIAQQNKNVMGSLYWMAPEIFTKQIYNEKTDVFGAGVVLGEVISLFEPIYKSDEWLIENRIDENSFAKTLPDIGRTKEPTRSHFYKLYHQLTMFDPAKRPRAAEVREELAYCLKA